MVYQCLFVFKKRILDRLFSPCCIAFFCCCLLCLMSILLSIITLFLVLASIFERSFVVVLEFVFSFCTKVTSSVGHRSCLLRNHMTLCSYVLYTCMLMSEQMEHGTFKHPGNCTPRCNKLVQVHNFLIFLWDVGVKKKKKILKMIIKYSLLPVSVATHQMHMNGKCLFTKK